MFQIDVLFVYKILATSNVFKVTAANLAVTANQKS